MSIFLNTPKKEPGLFDQAPFRSHFIEFTFPQIIIQPLIARIPEIRAKGKIHFI